MVDVTATDHAFGMPAEIRSGWVTFRFENQGDATHFANFFRVDSTVTREVFLTDDRQRIGAGMVEPFPGGVGFHTAGRSSEYTVYLEPGNYFMACFTTTPSGEQHADLGMQSYFEVLPEDGGGAEPDPDATFVLTDYQVDLSGSLRPGRNVVAVRHESPAPYDSHLAVLDSDDRRSDVLEYFSGLEDPAATALAGGVEDTYDRTTYVTVDLSPGDYVWSSQEYGALGMMYPFTMTEEGDFVPDAIAADQGTPAPIEVTLSDGGLSTDEVPAPGPTRLETTVDRAGEHELTIMRLEPGSSPGDYGAYMDRLRAAHSAGTHDHGDSPRTGYEIPLGPTPAGGPLVLDLRPGVYAIGCFHDDEENDWQHIVDDGELIEFRVGEDSRE